MEKILYAGLGQADITPPLGSELYGYYPHPVAKTITDRLIAYALALGNAKEKIIIFSIPVCLIASEIADRARSEIKMATNVPASNVILCATHTHSGPKTDNLSGHGVIDDVFCKDIFYPMLTEAAVSALKAMVPVEVGIGEGESKVGINRRQLNPDNTISFGQNPWGCYDPAMTVVSFRNAETHKLILSLIHYGAHNTSAGKVDTVTRDWCGVMCDRLEMISGAPVMYINGCEGDVGPRLSNGGTTGNMLFVNEIGNLAALDAVRIWKTIREYSTRELNVVTGNVNLKFSKTNDDNSNNEKEFHFEQTIVRLGNTIFIPLPFEAFSMISLRLRAYSGWQHTLCIGAANGSYNYLPSRDQLCFGGYEVDMFRSGFKSDCDYRLADDTDYTIISENLRLLKELNK